MSMLKPLTCALDERIKVNVASLVRILSGGFQQMRMLTNVEHNLGILIFERTLSQNYRCLEKHSGHLFDMTEACGSACEF